MGVLECRSLLQFWTVSLTLVEPKPAQADAEKAASSHAQSLSRTRAAGCSGSGHPAVYQYGDSELDIDRGGSRLESCSHPFAGQCSHSRYSVVLESVRHPDPSSPAGIHPVFCKALWPMACCWRKDRKKALWLTPDPRVSLAAASPALPAQLRINLNSVHSEILTSLYVDPSLLRTDFDCNQN